MSEYLSYTDFIADVSIKHEQLFRKFGWRYGQTFFNMLAQSDMEIARKIRGTELDPFFVEQVTEFQHKIIEGLWNESRRQGL